MNSFWNTRISKFLISKNCCGLTKKVERCVAQLFAKKFKVIPFEFKQNHQN